MTLKAQLREKTGTAASRQARAEGKIPVSLYASEFEATSLLVDRREFEALLKKEGQNAVFNLEFDGKTQQVLIKNFDKAALKDEFYALDFQAVSANEKLQVEVPVVLLNVESVEEGVVDQVTNAVLVESKPADIPASIEFDVEGLAIGDVKNASDLTLPSGVSLLTDPETTIVSIAVPTVVTEEDEAEADEDAEEPALVGEEEESEEA
ncbi:TPA: 50S ribosomal protein L25 [Streptococcus suis]